MRIKKKQDKITGVGSHIPIKNGDGNFIGIAKFSKPGALLLKSHLMREKNNKKDYYTHVINKIIEERKIVNFFDCKKYFWKEIDTYKDLCDMKAVINKKNLNIVLYEEKNCLCLYVSRYFTRRAYKYS